MYLFRFAFFFCAILFNILFCLNSISPHAHFHSSELNEALDFGEYVCVFAIINVLISALYSQLADNHFSTHTIVSMAHWAVLTTFTFRFYYNGNSMQIITFFFHFNNALEFPFCTL